MHGNHGDSNQEYAYDHLSGTPSSNPHLMYLANSRQNPPPNSGEGGSGGGGGGNAASHGGESGGVSAAVVGSGEEGKCGLCQGTDEQNLKTGQPEVQISCSDCHRTGSARWLIFGTFC